ncbi:MAG: penicillin-binding transpeptidase domain-containing protein [Bacteroidota bacterium]
MSLPYGHSTLCPSRLGTEADPFDFVNARRTILNRLYVVLGGVLLLPVAVVVQMLVLHLVDGPELRAEGNKQASTFEELPAQRGAILDQAGRVLVQNTARFEVAADPTVAGFEEKQEDLVQVLGRTTGRGAEHFRRAIASRASRQYVLLVHSLSESAKEELDALDIPGLLVKATYARRYTYGDAMAHVLGHVDRDMDGRAGVEAVHDEALRGEPGRRAVLRDMRKNIRAIVGGHVVEPQHGETVVLTLDLVRQSILEEELARGVAEAGATWGTAVAMDPETGAILALANVPTYDPNRTSAYSASARRNHAVVDRIEPGSTFKLVTAVAAMETGAVGLDDVFDTGEGWHVFHGETMKDTRAHGTITLGEAIKVSSNIAMGMTAERIGASGFYATARAMGFGQPTLVDLPGEVPGTLRKPEDWGVHTLPWMSTGYSMEATPVQMTAAYAALANGGLLVRPHVVAERRDARGEVTWRAPVDSVRRAFSERTAERLLPEFERVVMEEGGTARSASVPGLRVAGKTGTAQSAAGGSYARRTYRASFAGMFPADDPEVVLYILLHNPSHGFYGGTVAAPVFGRVARRWVGTFPSIAQRMAPAEPLPAHEAAVLPRVDGMPAPLAASRLRASGLTPRLPRRADWTPVAYRDAEPGASVRTDRTVRLGEAPASAPDTLGTEAVMPDLRGLSTRHAIAWRRSHGVRPRLDGGGVVRTQSVAPGAALPSSVTLSASR